MTEHSQKVLIHFLGIVKQELTEDNYQKCIEIFD